MHVWTSNRRNCHMAAAVLIIPNETAHLPYILLLMMPPSPLFPSFTASPSWPHPSSPPTESCPCMSTLSCRYPTHPRYVRWHQQRYPPNSATPPDHALPAVIPPTPGQSPPTPGTACSRTRCRTRSGQPPRYLGSRAGCSAFGCHRSWLPDLAQVMTTPVPWTSLRPWGCQSAELWPGRCLEGHRGRSSRPGSLLGWPGPCVPGPGPGACLPRCRWGWARPRLRSLLVHLRRDGRSLVCLLRHLE